MRVLELEKQKPHLFLVEAGLLLFKGQVYVHTARPQNMTRDTPQHPQCTSCWPPGNLQDQQTNQMTILVADTTHRCKDVCQRL